jgi:putative permease
MSNVLTSWFRRYLSSAEALTIVTIVIVFIATVHFLGGIFAPIIASIIFAYMLLPIVKKLEAIKIPHLLAVCIVFIIFLGLFFWLAFWLIPLLWQQLVTLFNSVPELMAKSQNILLELNKQFPQIASIEQMQQFVMSLRGEFANIGKFMWSFSLASITSIVTATIYLVLVPLLVFFFLNDSKVILDWSKRFLPKQRTSLTKIWTEVDLKMGSFIKGKIIEMLIVTLVTTVAFALLGLSYSALLGVLVGISVIIPYVGVVIATIPIIIVGYLDFGTGSQFLYLLGVYAIIITLDANVLVPMLFSGVLELHPVAIILGILIFGSLGGFWGVFFAIPLIILINALLKFWPCRE